MRKAQEVEKRFIGIDLGKRTHQDAFVTGKKVVFSSGINTPDGRQALYKKLRPSDTVAIEAGNLAFIMAKEMEKAVGCKVLVLNPGSLAIIYRSMKKTDKEDSLKLAHLVQYMPEENLPEVAIPSDKEMERREMVCERKQSVWERTKYINELHGLFLKEGITTIVKKDLATGGKREEVIGRLTGALRSRAESILKMLEYLEEEIERIRGLIAADAETDEQIQRLETIPGVGMITAYAYTAYVQAERFGNARQVCNYLGLVPRVDISCTIVKYGGITKRGNGYVRALLNQASWALVRSKDGGALKEWYYYLTGECGKSKKKAIVAVSRKLSALMYTLLRNGTDYEVRKFTVPKKAEEKKGEGTEKLASAALNEASREEKRVA
jgi:transposase